MSSALFPLRDGGTDADPSLAIPAPPRRLRPCPARRRPGALEEATAAASAALALAILASEVLVHLFG
jgi:hypothetical protein